MLIRKKIGVISLGCDKNRVDTEKMLARISKEHQIVSNPEDAEIIVINTCAFLQSSREEAIEEILSVAQLKESGRLEKIIVCGCLPQKFIGEIFDELVEADAFLGVADYNKILWVIQELYSENKRINAVGEIDFSCDEYTNRYLTTKGYAYLKIADGCSNHCTYCLIPKIRGRFRSIKEDVLLEEAKGLGNVKELILVAQDTAKYGEDLENKTNLVRLIKKLSALDNVDSIRLLYCYPENVSEELIEELKNNPKLIKYIDMPLQHASDRILKLMNRKGNKEQYLSLIAKLKEQVEGIAIRSTFITGFPTETEEDFNSLVDFLQKAKLFNAGFFAYSREEGTSAYKLEGQVEEKVKKARLKKLYSVQKKVVKQNLSKLIGKEIPVTVEGFDENELCYYGRAYFNAPEIDGKVYFFSVNDVDYGDEINVRILQNTDYDLYGEQV